MDVRGFVDDFAGKMNSNIATSLAGTMNKPENNNNSFAYLLLLLLIFGWGYGNRGNYNYGYNCCCGNNYSNYLTCYDPCVRNSKRRKNKSCNNYTYMTPYYYGVNNNCCNNCYSGNYGGNLWWFILVILLLGVGFNHNSNNKNVNNKVVTQNKQEAYDIEEEYECNGVMDFND